MPYASSRQYSAASLVPTLGGTQVGFLKSVEGGEPVGVVINEPPDGGGIVKKHIGSVSYQPITMTFGTGMDKSVYQWITDSLNHQPSARNGAIIVTDYNYKEKFRLEFENALIAAIGFPALDAQSKDPAVISLTLQPQVARANAASLGSRVQGFGTVSKNRWLLSNFRLKISGLETACSKVNAVDALVVTQPVIVIGDHTAPGTLLVPNLAFTVAESAAQDILTWADDFLVKGKNDQTNERSGTLEFLDAALQATLFTVSFLNLGVIRANRLRAEENAGVIARIAVQLYCEQMSFAADKAVAGTATRSSSTPASTSTTSGSTPSIPLTETLINIIAGRLTPESALEAAVSTTGTPQAAAAGIGSAPEVVARRLLTTVRSAPVGPVVPKWDDGVALGQQWATDTATIDELTAIKTINQDDWSALKLPTGHSLVDTLRSSAMIPAGADGPLQLERDPFVEGIVTGAIQVLAGATPHLTRLSQ